MTMEVPENVLEAIVVFVGLQRVFHPNDEDFLVNHLPVLEDWLDGLGRLPDNGATMLDHSCQVQRHALSERRDDLYETPPVAIEALLRHERLPQRLWDPCCGPGNIVNVLRAAGHEVLASDLVDYGDPTHFYRRDFLMERKAPDGCEGVVMNPPFKLAEEFIAHALDLSPLVIVLLRLAFMESERRTRILEGRGLARIHQFRKRLPMMHRAGWEGRKANSGMAFCWMIWDRSHAGPTTIDRISWERP
jgi:hypothetical protein